VVRRPPRVMRSVRCLQRQQSALARTCGWHRARHTDEGFIGYDENVRVALLGPAGSRSVFVGVPSAGTASERFPVVGSSSLLLCGPSPRRDHASGFSASRAQRVRCGRAGGGSTIAFARRAGSRCRRAEVLPISGVLSPGCFVTHGGLRSVRASFTLHSAGGCLAWFQTAPNKALQQTDRRAVVCCGKRVRRSRGARC